MHAYIHTYIHTFIHTCIHTHTHTHIHLHTYIRTYIYTYIHTYIMYISSCILMYTEMATIFGFVKLKRLSVQSTQFVIDTREYVMWNDCTVNMQSKKYYKETSTDARGRKRASQPESYQKEINTSNCPVPTDNLIHASPSAFRSSSPLMRLPSKRLILFR